MLLKSKLLLTICLVAILLEGCNCENKKLCVYSIDYYNLREIKEGKFDYDIARKWYLDENPYRECACYILIRNSNLVIENRYENNGVDVYKGDYGYFIGVDDGVYDGWVRYYPYNSGAMKYESSIVANENCKGIVMINREKGYIITCNLFETGSNIGSVYELTCDNDKKTWEWTRAVTIKDYPLVSAYCEEDELLYVITDNSILSIDYKHNIHILKNTDFPAKVAPNSAVVFGGNLYCGSPMGIYEFEIDSGKEHWYPMNYSKYVK